MHGPYAHVGLSNRLREEAKMRSASSAFHPLPLVSFALECESKKEHINYSEQLMHDCSS